MVTSTCLNGKAAYWYDPINGLLQYQFCFDHRSEIQLHLGYEFYGDDKVEEDNNDKPPLPPPSPPHIKQVLFNLRNVTFL